jgi:hypothetical protein
MRIQKAARGRNYFKEDAKKWKDTNNEVLQTCNFSGQEMMVLQKNDFQAHLFELHYLRYISEPFEGMELAKENAPEFAKLVLFDLINNIHTK